MALPSRRSSFAIICCGSLSQQRAEKYKLLRSKNTQTSVLSDEGAPCFGSFCVKPEMAGPLAYTVSSSRPSIRIGDATRIEWTVARPAASRTIISGGAGAGGPSTGIGARSPTGGVEAGGSDDVWAAAGQGVRKITLSSTRQKVP